VELCRHAFPPRPWQAVYIRVAIETRVRERVNARRSPPHVYPRALAIIVADR